MAALTSVTDESRTMLLSGLAHSSHQWNFGHIGAAVRFVV